MSAPLPIELRLERSKRISNLKLDFLKRLHDRHTFAELYCDGMVELHVHFADKGMSCATYRKIQGGKFGIAGCVQHSNHIALNDREFPMLVWVRDLAECFRPLASFVRLQPLDYCYMGGIDALEPASLNPMRESLWRVFNGKLCSVLRDAGIELGEFENEIVEGASEVVANLSNENGNTNRDRYPDRPDANWIRRARIEFDSEGIFVKLPQSLDSGPQISKVFCCPRYSFERAVEYVKGHDTMR